jgi:hypothetical protein
MLTTLAFYTVLGTTSIALPGGPPVGMDYLAYDAANHRVWAPAGNTGNVDVVDVTTGKVTAIGGFPTIPAPRPGRPNMGPSSASVGEGVVWVGNRGDNKICAFDGRSLEKRACVQLPAMPDGVQYVAATHELWVTTPRDQTLTIVDVKGKAPSVTTTIKVEGAPEGYALDGSRGVFYTNLEDKDRTLAIDVKTRKVVSNWPSGCGGEGPRGIAVDGARHLLLVACTDGAVTLDLAHDAKLLGRVKTGKGVDNIDYVAARKLLYIASRDDATLTVAAVKDGGALDVVATAPTAKGARNAVVDGAGTAYVADSTGGALIVVKAPAP